MAKLVIRASRDSLEQAQREILKRLTELRARAMKGEILLQSLEIEYRSLPPTPWKVS